MSAIRGQLHSKTESERCGRRICSTWSRLSYHDQNGTRSGVAVGIPLSDVQQGVEPLLAQVLVEHLEERLVRGMAGRDAEKRSLFGKRERSMRVVDHDRSNRQGLAYGGADQPEARLAVDQDLHGGDADRLAA